MSAEITITINVPDAVHGVVTRLERMERHIMGAVADALADVKAELVKAQAEIVAKINGLEDQLSNAGKLDDADQAAIADIKTAAKALDDIVPDAPADQPEQPPIA